MKTMYATTFIILLYMLLSIFTSTANAIKFWSIIFDVDVKETTATVGRPFEIPIYIKNQGTLVDAYTVRINATGPYAQYVMITQNVITTKPLESGQTEKISNELRVISSVEVPVDIWVYSNSDLTACTTKDDCKYLKDYDCDPISHKCTVHKKEVMIRTGLLSLPEFNWYGLIVIMSIAAVLLATSKNFK